MQLKTLILRKNEERRLKAGHLWVFSNEIDVDKTPLAGFERGEFVNVLDASGVFLATAYVNSSSLIAARVVSRLKNNPLGGELLRSRLRAAVSLRENLFAPFTNSNNSYRLVHAEGDFLPGLVIDRYGNDFVVQITTAGMENIKGDIAAALQEIFPGCAIILRPDTQTRALEGLPVELGYKLSPTEGSAAEFLFLKEYGLEFSCPALSGQKTGWFYDQRASRHKVLQLAKGLSSPHVLDAFCYAGGFGVSAAAGGAAKVTFLDASEPALELARKNMALNGLETEADFLNADALTALEELKNKGEAFDIVCLDPPAFIKRKKDEKAGLAAYYRANEQALALVKRGGYLVTSSCSQHLGRDTFRRILSSIAARRRLTMQIIGEGRQDFDHPVPPSMPETEYLKTFFVRVL